jgi:hypothetical protein
MTPRCVDAAAMVRLLSVLLASAVGLSACAATETTEEATEEATEELAVQDDLVTVAAQLQCDRQRFTFDSLDQLDTLVDSSLEAAGVTPDEFAEFEAELADDADLRLAVLAEFETHCGS